MGTARPGGSFLLKLAQFPRISCTNRIYSWDKVKCQFQQYLIIDYLKALIAKVGRITWSLTCDVGACAQHVLQKWCFPWIPFILLPPLPIAKWDTTNGCQRRTGSQPSWMVARTERNGNR